MGACPEYVQKKLGAAWTGRGRPPTGYFTKRLVEDWLRDVLHEAHRGTLAGQLRTGATFADAAAEWLRYVELDRQRKPSTIDGYKAIVRAQLLPVFGTLGDAPRSAPLVRTVCCLPSGQLHVG